MLARHPRERNSYAINALCAIQRALTTCPVPIEGFFIASGNEITDGLIKTGLEFFDFGVENTESEILNWLDQSGRVIDASVKRPPKFVRARERLADEATESFLVHQVYDNVARRLLHHVGMPVQRPLTELLPDPTQRAVTSEEWALPEVGGLRLRSKLVFTNGRGQPSQAVFVHRFGHVAIHGGVEANVGIPIEPVKIGVNGSGTVDVDVLMATDPTITVRPLLPWGEESCSLTSYLGEFLEELSRETEADIETLRDALNDVYRDYLTYEPNGWEVEPRDEAVQVGEGDVKRVHLDVRASTAGQTMLAITAQAPDGDENVSATSELALLHATPDLDIYLLADVGGETIPLVDEAGLLSPAAERAVAT